MIILVKVNSTYVHGADLRFAAYRSWRCGRLLNETEFRNQFKYLVAYYKGEIVGTFCIHGVALDSPNHDPNRKVKFLIKETDDECDKYIRSIIQPLIINNDRRILYAQSFCYLKTDYLSQNLEDFKNFKCKCSIEKIPVLEPEKIIEDTPVLEKEHGQKQLNKIDNAQPPPFPPKLWFKLTINRNYWDSFGHPNSKETKVVIIYPYSDNLRYEKSDNLSGTLNTSIITVDGGNLRKIEYIISIFQKNPLEAVQKIKDSKVTTHISHYNGFEIEFEAFNDSHLNNRIQHANWSGNVLLAEDGFLRRISKIIL